MNAAFPQSGANLSKQASYSAGLEFGLTGVAQTVELAIGIGFDPDASNRIPSNAAFRDAAERIAAISILPSIRNGSFVSPDADCTRTQPIDGDVVAAVYHPLDVIDEKLPLRVEVRARLQACVSRCAELPNTRVHNLFMLRGSNSRGRFIYTMDIVPSQVAMRKQGQHEKE
jgi:hypothetical protein